MPGKPSTDTASSLITGVTVLGKAATIDRHGVHVKAGPGIPPRCRRRTRRCSTRYSKRGLWDQAGVDLPLQWPYRAHRLGRGSRDVLQAHGQGRPAGHDRPAAGHSVPDQVDLQQASGRHLRRCRAEPQCEVPRPDRPRPGQRGQSRAAGREGSQRSESAGRHSTPGGGGGTTGTGSTGRGPTNFGGTGPTGSTSITPPSGQTPPEIAAAPQSFADPLKGLAGRLWWFFPLAAISVLGLAGRLRIPARFPGESD